ncbi:putative pyrophosphatase/phosphodiesterase [Smittium mucronatum]|uniref:Putative pyrophosphatase/phosphodiesterase n=1 Tax=Smittium mucronatum TaxID=133383 RepID=A0A1R0GW37_9FUNG|nr:putative pyrophosphatase/phosphodiesterase [Smittium mucronatum]
MSNKSVSYSERLFDFQRVSTSTFHDDSSTSQEEKYEENISNQDSKKKIIRFFIYFVSFLVSILFIGFLSAFFTNSKESTSHEASNDSKSNIAHPKLYKGPNQKFSSESNFNSSDSVILLSIDGFKASYFELGLTPNLVKLGKNGIFPEYMIPSFPTITFPNHYTIATGLYPESHGIIGNAFYDPLLNDTFSYKKPSSTDSKWWGGEPIWVTAAINNIKSATCMFPGSESEIKGHRPTYWFPYDDEMSQTHKIDQIIEWLLLPPNIRPSLILSYFPEVDSAGHNFGPSSKQVNDTLIQIDNTIGYLISKLTDNNLLNSSNIIIVSDHGMSTSLVPTHSVSLNSLLSKSNLSHLDVDRQSINFTSPKIFKNKNLVSSVHLWPHAGITPSKAEDTLYIYNKLLKSQDSSKYKVYLKKDVPKRLFFNQGARIPPILIIAEKPYFITYYPAKSSSSAKDSKNRYGHKNSKGKEKWFSHTNSFNDADTFPNFYSKTPKTLGVHGYDNLDDDMRSIFIAHGNKFRSPKSNKSHTLFNFPHINNVDVYNILAKLIDVSPAPNNGSISVVQSMVKKFV